MALLKNKIADIEFAEEDFSIIPSFKKYYVLTVNGPGENPVPVDIWSYAIFFYINFQKKDISEENVYLDGINIERYMEYFCEKQYISKIPEFITDFIIYDFQKTMKDNYGVHINIFALYGLCMYIKEIINRRLCILFKPTVKETIEELKGIDNINEITVTCKDGKTHHTTNELTKELFLKSLQDSNNIEYEFDHVERCVNIFSKEYAQVEFIRLVTNFLIHYFKINRRRNCVISIIEQRMLCFFLYFFEFTPAIVSESRIRQLMNSKIHLADSWFNLNYNNILNKNIYIYVALIPYSDWKNGRINPLEYKPIAFQSSNKKEKFIIKIGHDRQRISELITEIQKVMNGFS